MWIEDLAGGGTPAVRIAKDGRTMHVMEVTVHKCPKCFGDTGCSDLGCVCECYFCCEENPPHHCQDPRNGCRP